MDSKQRFYIHGSAEAINAAFPNRKGKDDRVSASGAVILIEVNVPKGTSIDIPKDLTVVTQEEAAAFVRSASFTGAASEEKSTARPKWGKQPKGDATE